MTTPGTPDERPRGRFERRGHPRAVSEDAAGVPFGSLRAEAVEAVGVIEGLRGDIAVNIGRPGSFTDAIQVAARALVSPALRLCLLLRLGARASNHTYWLWRNLLIILHGSEVQPGAIFAPGLRLPVPFGIAIAANARTGRDVTIENRTNFALRAETGRMSPRRTLVDDGAVIASGTTLMGGVQVGAGAFVGPGCMVTHSVKPASRPKPYSRH